MKKLLLLLVSLVSLPTFASVSANVSFASDYIIIFIWLTLPWYLGSDFFPQFVRVKIITKKMVNNFI